MIRRTGHHPDYLLAKGYTAAMLTQVAAHQALLDEALRPKP